ncbi:hypothetical protein MASR2M39_19610 [Ignavibacteriales bacterium]
MVTNNFSYLYFSGTTPDEKGVGGFVDDLNYIVDKGNDKSHFLGAIVTLPMNSGP